MILYNNSARLFNGIANLKFVIFSCLVIALTFGFTACESDEDDPLAGDLSFEVEGPEGMTIQPSVETWDGSDFSGSSESATIPSSGLYTEDIDDGDYEGVRVNVSPVTQEEPEFFVVRLISNEEVIEETDSRNEEGFYEVRVGDLPDFGDF